MRTLGDFFPERVFPEDEKFRIVRAAASQGSAPARALRSYATRTDAYLNGFEKHEHIHGFRPGTTFYRKRAVEILTKWLGEQKGSAWAIYRQAATMFIEKELSKLNTLLSEVPAPVGDLTVAEALKLVCNRSSEYGVSKEDIIQFYEVWGVERAPDFEASIDDWMKPDELALQRRQLATAVTAVGGLTKSVGDVAAEAAALRQLIGRAQQSQAEDRSAQKILGDAHRKLDETVAALAEEVRRGEGRLKALEDGSRNSVATSTLKSEVQRMEASTKAAITTATEAARAALADAFNAELSRAKAELERELQELSSKLSEATASVAPFKGSSGYPSPFAGTPRSPGESINDVATLRRAL